MSAQPSNAQLEAFARHRSRPVALVVQFSGKASLPQERLIWAARSEQVFCGPIARYDETRLYEFRDGNAALAFAESLCKLSLATLEVAAVSVQPRAIRITSAVMSRVLPHWPFDNTEENSEEPGVGTSSVMPTHAAIEELRTHADQRSPVTMVNWLKFKPGDGRAAYYRYGKVALVTTHSLGAKLVYAARYLQILIGNGGDPASSKWDEFALMQYPGRETFGRMARLKRYRVALHHREQGLAPNGQGLVVTKPAPEFTWR
jgi:hypothetical protein